MDGQDPPSPKDTFEVANAYLKRLERLVLKVLGLRFKSGNELWQVQVDLYKLQREVQASIAKRKAEKRTEEIREQIDALRIVRWHARRFGDALAWLMYRGERRLLYPLSWNDEVPIEPENGRPSPATMAAEALSERLGFPLLHDITDLLRIGDCSFIPFEGKGPPQMVEFKSQVVGEEREGSLTKIRYEMTAVWPADGPPPNLTPARAASSSNPPMRQAALRSKRFHQQLKRMSRAHAHRTAEMGKATTIDGTPTLMLEGHLDEAPGHWPLIRRLIRRAKRTGYAVGTAEQATLYVVIYNKDGFHSAEDFGLRRVKDDLLASDIWFEDRSKNSMRFEGLPDPRQRGPHRYLPYYLYPIPRTAILDILHGRLGIISILNVGRLAAAIEEQGLKVELPGRHGPMGVLTDIEVDGVRLLVDLANLEESVTEMVMEARSLSYVAGMAARMAEGIALLMPDMVRETWAREAEAEQHSP